MPQLFYIGIKGLIKNSQGQYLLLQANVTKHRKNTEPYWDIPGGRIEEGEGAIPTLKREIFEETGIEQVTDIKFLTSVISNHIIPIDDDKQAGLALFIYTVTIPDDSKIVLEPEEHDDYAWFSASDAAEKLSHKYPAEFTSQLV